MALSVVLYVVLKFVSSKVSLKLHVYLHSFVAVCERLLQEPVLLKASLHLPTGWSWWALSR